MVSIERDFTPIKIVLDEPREVSAMRLIADSEVATDKVFNKEEAQDIYNLLNILSSLLKEY